MMAPKPWRKPRPSIARLSAQPLFFVATAVIMWTQLAAATAVETSAQMPPAEVTVSLPEGAPVDTHVVNLSRRLGFNNQQQQKIEMFKVINEEAAGKLFRLDARTGRITTRVVIGREAMAAGGSPCESACKFSILVHVTFKDRPPHLLTVAIELQEQNNHAPEFRVFAETVEISELAEVNRTTVGLPFEILDRDSPRFGLRELRVSTADPNDPSADGVFDVRPRHVSADEHAPLRVSLVLLKPLDRETRELYRLVLVARAAGSPPKSGSQTFTVTVRDENDHQPRWLTTDFEFSVSEAAPDGFLVVKLRAEDSDAGRNGRVVYLFNDAQPYRPELQSFELDGNTGELRVRRSAGLDYERTRIYRLTVVARDQGLVPKQTEALVTIRLLDENDETPQIQVNSISTSPSAPMMSSAASPTVREGRSPGEIIGYVIATDQDSGDNSQVTCRLAAGTELAINLQQSQERRSVYQLATSVEFDWERQKQVADTIVCADAGRPPRTASHVLRVTIIDENDSPPRFTQPVYRISFEEEQEPGTHIHRVSAVDPDQNPQLAYSLDPASERIVSIGQSSGALQSKHRFDRESLDSYRFEVRVTDGRFWDNATVELTIRDVNDHWPEWTGRQELSVTENSPVGTLVGRVAATDADAGENGRVGYAILPPSLYFEIRSDGSIYTRSNRLDREQTPHLDINVTAHDWGRPRKSRWERMSIRLLDANDNSPTFAYPGSAGDNRVNISCREAPNAAVARVSASDPDEGDNGRVTYNLTEDGWRAGFGIDPHTGDVLLARPLDCDQQHRVVTLRVSARDNGSPPRSSVRILLVAKVDRAPARARGPGRGGSVGGGGGGSGGGAYSGDEATSLTAVVGLMIATGVLILVLVFAICLLRRRSAAASAAAAVDGRVASPGGKHGTDKRRHGTAVTGKDISLPQQIGVDRTLLLKSHNLQHSCTLQGRGAHASAAHHAARLEFDQSPPPGYYYPDNNKQRDLQQQQQQQQQQQLHDLAMHQMFPQQQQQQQLQRNATLLNSSSTSGAVATASASSYQTIRPCLSGGAGGATTTGAEMMANNGYSLLPALSADEEEPDVNLAVRTLGRRKSSSGDNAMMATASAGGAGSGGGAAAAAATMDLKQLRTPYTTVSLV